MSLPVSTRTPGARSITLLAAAFALAMSSQAQPLVNQYPRAYAINHDPWLESKNQLLHAYAHWNSPSGNNALYAADLANSSHGLMKYRITTSIDMDEWPIKYDGYRYTDDAYLACLANGGGWHSPDGVNYKSVARDFDLARRVDFGEIDEVFMSGAPYFGYWESTMAGLGGYWCNSGPQDRIACSRIFVMMGFNYERYIGEMLEDYGHRSESVLRYVYGSWDPVPTHAWNRFTLYDNIAPGNAACGNVHYAPNSLSDYDWGNTTYVWSTGDDWLNNYPNLTNQKTWVNCVEWGCEIRAHHNWWFKHFPHVAGSLTEYGLTRLNNWWEYTQNFNAHVESNGDHAPGGVPPTALPFAGTTFRLTTDTTDQWRPQVNAAGRVVWSGFDATLGRWRIYSANLDGSDLHGLGSGGKGAEQVHINAAGQVVWQQFDGKRWQIWTSNADGTSVRQITNSAFQSWHPDISDSGRIVWDQFDGEDYEIYSANVDGSSLVRITNNTHNGVGQPRDDVWPRINAAGRVVWMGYNGSNWAIFSANADGSGLVQVSNTGYENEYPQINSAGKVVWQAWLSDWQCELFMANANGTGVQQLTSTGTLNWWPQINSHNDLVWMQRGNKWQIMRRLASGTTTALTDGNTNAGYPVIDDNGRVAWQGFDAAHWQIYLYQNDLLYQVTSTAYDNHAPALASGGSLAWHGQAALGNPNDPNYPGPTTEIFTATDHDLQPPQLVSVTSIGSPTRVAVMFSEPVDPNTAQNPANYAIDQGVAVSAATLAADQLTVLLTTSPLLNGVGYTLIVNNVRDLDGNPIAPNTTTTFVHERARRVVAGLQTLYDFKEGSGTTVHDVSGVGAPLDLNIADPGNTTWSNDGLQIDDATVVRSPAPASKIIAACVASNELTLEAWLVPFAAAASGPARIMTVSPHENSNDFMFGQGPDNGSPGAVYTMHVQTTTYPPALSTPAGSAAPELQHVLYTRDSAGHARIWLNGQLAASATVGGTFAGWYPTYVLSLANEATRSRPWFGQFQLAAVYSRALTPAEVLQNFDFGAGHSGGLPGDMNCDGHVDFGDINPFVLALTDPGAWQAAYPGCPLSNGDLNGNGRVEFGDINPFVALLAGK